MARYDKITFSFRAPLNAAWPAGSALGNVGRVTAVSLNTSGRVVVGGGSAAAICGVVVVDGPKAVGDIVDVLVMGEIVDVSSTDVTNMSAGDTVYAAGGAAPTGQLTDVSTASKRVGRMVEAPAGQGRLIVCVDGFVGA
jgi:hypothetical protein